MLIQNGILSILPISYRIIILFNLGVFYFYLLILICCYFLRIQNVMRLLNLQDIFVNLSSINHANPYDGSVSFNLKMGKFLKSLTVINLISYGTFVVLQLFLLNGKSSASNLIELIPLFTIMANLYFVFASEKFKSIFKTIFKGSISIGGQRFCDLLISDSLTSYSKVLLDFSLYMYSIFGSSLYDMNELLYGSADLIVLCLPQLIRLSQCWQEFKDSKKVHKQSFYNCCKYASNIAPLVMIFFSRIFSADIHEKYRLEYIAKLATLINSLYTFYWDIFIDWDIMKLMDTSVNEAYVFFLQFSVVFDFGLRFFWLLKFIFTSSKYFYYFHDTDPNLVLFIMELLEVTRRFFWCIHRINNESLKNLHIDDNRIEMNKIGGSSAVIE